MIAVPLVIAVVVLGLVRANRVETAMLRVNEEEIFACGSRADGWARTIRTAGIIRLEFRVEKSVSETETEPCGLWAMLYDVDVFLLELEDEPQGIEVLERIAGRFPRIPRKPFDEGALTGHIVRLGLSDGRLPTR